MNDLIQNIDTFVRLITAGFLISMVLAGRIIAALYTFHKWISRLNTARDVVLSGVAAGLVVNIITNTPVTPGLYALLVVAAPGCAVAITAAMVVVQSRRGSRSPHNHQHGF